MIYPLALFRVALVFLYVQAGLFLSLNTLCGQTELGTSLPRTSKSDDAQTHGGNHSFNFTYNRSLCGLNYARSSVVLQKRYAPLQGMNQPADMSISGLPCEDNVVIEQAWLYWVVETNNLFGISAKLTNPEGQTRSFSGTEIGNENPGKCWGCTYSRSFRADVTSHITGNGNYKVEDLPVGTTCDENGGDTDGALLLIVYRDLTATWQGNFRLYDGIQRRDNGDALQDMTGLSFCAPPTNARGFVLVTDYQLNTTPTWTATINGVKGPVSARFFNFEERNTTLLPAQTTSSFGASTGADCFAFIAAGLYYQTNGCQTCTPSAQVGSINGGTTICRGGSSTPLVYVGDASRIDTWETSINNGGTWVPANISSASWLPPDPTVTTWYRIRLKASSCPTQVTQHVIIKVDQPPTGGTIAGAGPICGNAAPPLLSLSGNSGPVVSWQSSANCPSFTTLTTLPPSGTTLQPPPASETRCYRAVVSGGACTNTVSTTVTLPWESNAPVGVLSGPTTVCSDAGQQLLTLSQTNESILRWEFSDDCTNFSNPSTLNHTDVTLNVFPPLSGKRCWRVVFAGNICPFRYSSVHSLQKFPATVGGTITGPTTVCPGAGLPALNLTGQQGSVLRWESATDCAFPAGITTINNTTATLSPQPILNNRCYRAVVKNGNCPEELSATHLITVATSETGGTLTPAMSEICTGQTAPVLTLQSPSPDLLRWERSTDGGQTWTTFAHLQTTYGPGAITQTTQYRAISRGLECAELISLPAEIKVSLSSKGGTALRDMTICSGSTAGPLSLSGERGNVVRWQQSINNGLTWSTLNNTSKSWTTGILFNSMKYRAVLMNGSCPVDTSTTITATVLQPTLAGIILADRTVCPTGNSGTLELTGERGQILRWETRVLTSPDWTTLNYTADILNYTNVTNSTAYRAVVANGVCDTLASQMATLTVFAPGNPGVLGPAQTICPGDQASILTLSGNSGLVIRWDRSTDGGQNWTSVSNNVNSYLPPLPTQSTTYRVALKEGNCPEGYSPTVELIVAGVRPNGALGSDLTICRSNNNGFLTLSNAQGTIKQWEQSSNGGNSWTSTAHTASQFQYTNLASETWFRVRVALAPCPDEYSDTLVVSMVEPPATGRVTGPAAACSSDGPVSLTLENQTGSIVRWEADTNCDFLNPQTINHTSSSFQAPPASSGRCYRAFVKGVAQCPPIASQSWFVRYDQPGNTGNITPTQNLCPGAIPVPISLSAFQGNITGWERSTDNFNNNIVPINQTGVTIAPDPFLKACYRAVLKVGECSAQKSPISCVILLPKPPVGTVLGGRTVCAGVSNIILVLSGSNGNIMGWESSIDGFVNDFQFNANQLTPFLQTGPINRNICYRVWVQTAGCPSLPSDTACIFVSDSTRSGQVLSSKSYCDASTPDTLRLSQYMGNILRWERSTNNFGQNTTTIANTTDRLPIGIDTQTACYRAIVQNAECPEKPAQAACISIDRPAVAGTIGGQSEVCQNEFPLTLTLNGSSGQPASWQRRNAAGALTSIPNATAQLQVQTASNEDCFRAIVSGGLCPADTSEWFCIQVSQTPVAGNIQGNNLICRGETTELSLINHSGTIETWESSTDGFNQNIVAFGGGETQPVLAPLNQNTCYRARISREFCNNVSTPVFCVEVRIPPFAGRITGAKKVCKGSNMGLLTVEDFSGQLLFWEFDTDPSFPSPTRLAQGQPQLQYANLQQSTWYRVVFAGDAICQQVRTEAVEVQVVRPQLNATFTPVRCRGEGNAEIRLQPSGGEPFTQGEPYVVEWTFPVGFNPANPLLIQNLSPASYCVRVRDSLGCQSDTCLSVSDPPEFLAFISGLRNLTCFESNNGGLTLLALGGVKPYTYIWHDGAGSNSRDDLPIGTYSPTVSDANGCSRVLGQVNLTQPPAIISTLSYISPVRCNGGNNAAIGVHISGGRGGYQYRWSHGPIVEDVSNLTAGVYTLTSTDITGCSRIDTFTVPEPEAIVVEVLNQKNVSCFGLMDGALELSITGGTEPYRYFWTRQGGVGNVLNNAGAGQVGLMITDAKNCQKWSVFTITQPEPLALQVETVRKPSCLGISNGQVRLEGKGGTAPYVHKWPDGSFLGLREDLPAGSYSITLTDAKACQSIYTFTLTAPPALRVEQLNIKQIRCFGGGTGSISMYVAGGTMPFAFHWSNGAQTEDINRLGPGFYVQSVTDAMGCTMTNAYTITEPPKLVAIASATSANCFGGATGSVSVAASGGTPGYSYAWADVSTQIERNSLPAGTYDVQVTDAMGCRAFASTTVSQPTPVVASINLLQALQCNQLAQLSASVSGGTGPYSILWSNGERIDLITAEDAGIWSFTATDRNGCTATANQVVSPAEQPEIEVFQVQKPNCSSKDGRIILTGRSSHEPLTWLWSDGHTGINREGLSSGLYSVTITDALGCQAQRSFDLTTPAAPVIDSVRIQMPSCFGAANGSIRIYSSSQGIRYRWFRDGQALNHFSPMISGQKAGFYQLWVIATNGCSVQRSFWLPDPQKLEVDLFTQQEPVCFDSQAGSLVAYGKGGNLPYSYQWSNGSRTQAIDNLTAGTYTLILTDAKGCKAYGQRSLTAPAALKVQSANIQPAACGLANKKGSISLVIQGGTAPYQYQWSDGGTTALREALSVGSYSLTATDANNCRLLAGPYIVEGAGNPPKAMLDFSRLPRCWDSKDGALGVKVSGGQAPYTYAWSNGWTTADIANLEVGIYTLTTTDAWGCQDTFRHVLVTAPLLNLSASIQRNVRCAGGSDGALGILVTGGNPEYSYQWAHGGNSPSLPNLRVGMYTLKVTDAKGCISTKAFEVAEPQALGIASQSIRPASCTSCADGRIDIKASGGKAPYTYILVEQSINQTNGLFSNLPSGTYTVRIEDAAGCTFARVLDLSAIPICRPPGGLTVRATGIKTLKADWPPVSGATSLVIAWQATTPSAFWSTQVLPPSATSYTLTGLTSGTSYRVRVRSICGDEVSPWSMLANGTTLSGRNSALAETTTQWQLYPNPSDGRIQVTIPEAAQKELEWRVHNLQGALVSSGDGTANESGQLQLALELASGIYRLEITGDRLPNLRRSLWIE